jgi:hypothetical protein
MAHVRWQSSTRSYGTSPEYVVLGCRIGFVQLEKLSSLRLVRCRVISFAEKESESFDNDIDIDPASVILDPDNTARSITRESSTVSYSRSESAPSHQYPHVSHTRTRPSRSQSTCIHRPFVIVIRYPYAFPTSFRGYDTARADKRP